MKKFLLVSLIVSILSVASYGQQTDTIITLPEIRLTAPSAVNANVTSAFRRAFPDAENLRWYRYDKDYLAKFIMYDMDHNSLFRKSGVMKYDISYGFERHIPEKIKEELRRKKLISNPATPDCIAKDIYENLLLLNANVKITKE